MSDTFFRDKYFRFDQRIKMWVPDVHAVWQDLDLETQNKIVGMWSRLRGEIPDKIRSREIEIMNLIDNMYKDVDFETFCQLNSDMIDLAAEVNELNIWSRFEPTLSNHKSEEESLNRAHF